MNNSPLVWQALEYEHKEKSSDWYWAVGIITFSVALTAFILGNYIFGIVVIVSGFSLAISASRKPEIATFELNKTGVVINSKQTSYTSLRSFYVETNELTDGRPKLLFQPKKSNRHMMIIPLEEVTPEEVRDFLLDMLLEEELHEPIAHQIAEFFGF